MTVEEFTTFHVSAYDAYKNPVKFKNLSAEDTPLGVTSLRERFQGVVVSKRKTDPDVSHLFPRMPEPDVTYVRLTDQQQDFYETVADYLESEADLDETNKPRNDVGLLRMITGHPAAIARGQGEAAVRLTEAIGLQTLLGIGSAKMDALAARLRLLTKGQGAQVVVFTYFGQSVLPLIMDRLTDEGILAVAHHGQMSAEQRSLAQGNFRAGKYEVLVSSDAGARGINLPEAQYVEEYDAALTHANFVQRINRINRINSVHDVVFAHTLVVRDTVEEGIVHKGLMRHEWDDKLLGDDDDGLTLMTAETRRALMRIRRGR